MSAQQYAEQAAEAIRGLNHATIDPDAYEWPSDVDQVITSLHMMVMRLEQALTQAGRWLDKAQVAGEIGHDQGHDTADAIAILLRRLARAGITSQDLADDLQAVRQITTHLTGTR